MAHKQKMELEELARVRRMKEEADREARERAEKENRRREEDVR